MSLTYSMKNTKLLLEESNKDLLNEIQKIFESCFPRYRETTQPNPNINNEFLSYAQGRFTSAFWNLIYIDHKLVGMITFGIIKGKKAHIYNGCILNKHQDSGYGTILFTNTLGKMRRFKIKTTTVAFAKDHGVRKIRKKAKKLGLKIVFDQVCSTWKVII